MSEGYFICGVCGERQCDGHPVTFALPKVAKRAAIERVIECARRLAVAGSENWQARPEGITEELAALVEAVKSMEKIG